MTAFKVPFPYLGNKARFYESFIKPEFEKSGKKIYIDPFAGSLSIPLSIKRDFPNVTVYANFFDPRIHRLLEVENMVELYQDTVRKIYGGEPEEFSYSIFQHDKARWTKLKCNYKEKVLGVKMCPYCHSPIQKDTKASQSPEDQFIDAIFSMNISGVSLRNSFYNAKMMQNIQNYEQAIKGLDVVTTKPFSELDWDYHNAFVFLDPPYIRSTKEKNGEFIGTGYAAGGEGWLPLDDRRLIDLVLNNPDNDFLIFGSEGNNLLTLATTECTVRQTFHFNYRANVFGHTANRTECAVLI